jgi:hypothetical protein
MVVGKQTGKYCHDLSIGYAQACADTAKGSS